MRKRIVLITGINGFLGSHLAKSLLSEFTIIGLETSLENLFRIKDIPFKVYSSQQNLEDIFTENEVFAVIHTATVYRRNKEPVESLISTNVILPIKLYELANKHNASKFINTDSFFTNFQNSFSYLSDYTLSKRQVIEWLKLIKGECELVNMKLFHIYGDGDSSSKFVSQMISALRNNDPYLELSLGEQKRDFVFIDDVVSAYKIILKKRLKGDPEISHYEIGTGISITIREFLELIKKLTQSQTELRFGALPYRANEVMDSFADNRKIVSLGWVQKYSLSDGLKKTINSICQ